MSDKIITADFNRKKRMQMIRSHVDIDNKLMVIEFENPKATYNFNMESAFAMAQIFDRAARCLKELEETGSVTNEEFLT
jgi:hypothetical protein